MPSRRVAKSRAFFSAFFSIFSSASSFPVNKPLDGTKVRTIQIGGTVVIILDAELGSVPLILWEYMRSAQTHDQFIRDVLTTYSSWLWGPG